MESIHTEAYPARSDRNSYAHWVSKGARSTFPYLDEDIYNWRNLMETNTYSIKGMGCDGCAKSIKSALEKSNKVASAHVSFPDEKATITSDLNKQELAEIVKESGYQLV